MSEPPGPLLPYLTACAIGLVGTLALWMAEVLRDDDD